MPVGYPEFGDGVFCMNVFARPGIGIVIWLDLYCMYRVRRLNDLRPVVKVLGPEYNDVLN